MGSKVSGGGDSFDIRHWDYAPSDEYFVELFRTSKYQIIWGGNYFQLPPSRNFLIWRKLSISETFSMAMAEFAWTNIEGNSKIFAFAPQGKINDKRFHPTQKPIELYSWIFKNYAKAGDKILDTHGGSMSSVIAALKAGLEIHCCELDADYYNAAKKRVLNYLDQETLFQERPNIIFKL